MLINDNRGLSLLINAQTFYDMFDNRITALQNQAAQQAAQQAALQAAQQAAQAVQQNAENHTQAEIQRRMALMGAAPALAALANADMDI